MALKTIFFHKTALKLLIHKFLKKNLLLWLIVGIPGFTLVLWKPCLSLAIVENLLLFIAYLLENELNFEQN
jgi:hypothetical protein